MHEPIIAENFVNLFARVDRLEARVANLAELAESLASGTPAPLQHDVDHGPWDSDEDLWSEGW